MLYPFGIIVSNAKELKYKSDLQTEEWCTRILISFNGKLGFIFQQVEF